MKLPETAETLAEFVDKFAVVMASYALLIFATFVASCFGQEAYISNSLNSHNNHRSAHHSPALTLSSDLNYRAYECAQYYSQKGTIDHSCPHKNGAGENLGWIMSSAGAPSQDTAAQRATDGWYEEVNNYNYDNPGDNSNGVTGHFTQLIWKSSTSFGIGSFQNFSTKSTYTCALYSPAGNIIWGGDGDRYQFYRENVLRP